ncbi:hypothetical protein [Desulfofundulus thermocisternus]|uniref:hypothetical protein n=1 Tax=Desulfofundulus thermocisternus TaxID=42471 RepID=UPI00217D6691|nr:hypothetical protein [Desulfofundulus thermocisternus]MCS5694603.1 hypothetical protein [Desulfofundulus thermocisternus]
MPELKLLKITRLSSHHFALPPSFLRSVVKEYGYRYLAVYQVRQDAGNRPGEC